MEKLGPAEKYNPPLEEFHFLNVKNMWRYMKGQHFSFWMICFYLFFEYTRPQALFPAINILPWASLFLLCSLMGAILDRTIKWVSSPMNFWMVLFALTIYLSSLTAFYPEVSKRFYIDFYSWFVVYFLIINIVNTKQRLYIFLLVFVICAAKIAIGTSKTWAMRGFSFTSWGLMGPEGYFQNSGELAVLMLTLFPLAYKLYSYLKHKVSRTEKYILIIFWVTPVLTIMGASSRGSQVALVIQLLIMFRRSFFRLKPLLGVLILCTVLFQILPDEQKTRFSSSGEDRTSQQRLLYWENGWDMMKKNPILGVGYFNFPRYYADFYPEDMLFRRNGELVAELPHNIFIQVGTDAGFTGLGIFMLLLFLPFNSYRKKRKKYDEDNFLVICLKGIIYGIIGFVLAGQFVTITYYPFIWIGLAFVGAIENVMLKEQVETDSGSKKINHGY